MSTLVRSNQIIICKHMVVLITGASKGIGLALAKHFLAHKYQVFGTSRTGKISDIEHDQFTGFPLDLSTTESIHKAISYIKNKGISIDILINNAGIGPDLNAIEPEESTYRKTFEVNTTGTLFFTEMIIPFINKQGKIINISSKMGSIAMCTSSDSVAYRMSKAALNMYSKILANKLQGKPKVAIVHPGWVRTMISGDDTLGRLSTEESARGIFDFVTSNFENATFWNTENQSLIPW